MRRVAASAGTPGLALRASRVAVMAVQQLTALPGLQLLDPRMDAGIC
jgi:hypothetical protein